jgi:hypothetical protein
VITYPNLLYLHFVQGDERHSGFRRAYSNSPCPSFVQGDELHSSFVTITTTSMHTHHMT